ncbi:uncharacterized protein trdc [Centroberyx affinis]|uniref:uncharacterized protein trdc n=1 Tax=Centroberyx affinis TaxID=166261 RepID=UPI003A5C5C97
MFRRCEGAKAVWRLAAGGGGEAGRGRGEGEGQAGLYKDAGVLGNGSSGGPPAARCPSFGRKRLRGDRRGTAYSTCTVKLLFGKAISLTVNLKDPSPASPTLSILRPLEGLGSDGGGPKVCLATGFYPKGAQMVLELSDNKTSITHSTSSAALSRTTKSYVYAGFSNEKIKSCELDGVVTKAEAEAEVEVEVEDPAPLVTQTPAAADTSPKEPEDLQPDNRKFNFSLLVVNGLRVLFFTKTLVFNTIFTIKALLY